MPVLTNVMAVGSRTRAENKSSGSFLKYLRWKIVSSLTYRVTSEHEDLFTVELKQNKPVCTAGRSQFARLKEAGCEIPFHNSL